MLDTKRSIIKSPYFLPGCMWFLCTIFYGYQYLLQVSPSVMTQDLMSIFQVNATMLGNLAACYLYPYAAMQIPVGLVFDHFGARRPLLIAIILCALGSYLFAATSNFGVTILGRLLIGFGASFAVVGSLYIAASWLPLKRFSLLLGITITVGMIGASCGQAPLALLVNLVNWRNAMFIFAALGFLIFIGAIFILRDIPKINLPNIPDDSNDSTTLSVWYRLKAIMKNKQIWLLSTYNGLMFMPITVFGSLWGTPFLMRKYEISNSAAGSMLIMLFFGLAVGSPFFGWLSDHIKKRNIIMLISAIGSLVSLFAVIYPQFPPFVTSLLLFSYGFFSGGLFVSYASTREVDTTHSTGAAMGFINTASMIGGAIAQPLVGLFLDLGWDGVMEQGARAYSALDFKLSFTILPVAIAIATLVMFFVKETHCKQQD